VLNHFSLRRDLPVRERVELAAAAGFSALGLYVLQYAQLEDEGFAPAELHELLDRHDMCIAEIEVISGLGADGIGSTRAAEMEAVAWRMADEFHCRYMQVIGPSELPTADAGRAYAGLCDRAADHDLVLGLEFLPFTDIVSVHDARRIVEAADRPNAGICVDIWHHSRGANDLAAIAALPGEMITGIQMSDGTLVPQNPDYYTDCLENRVAPGDGEFDVAGFVAAVRGTGSTVPFALEVCSAAGWADPAPHVQRIADGMRRFL
jgi:sugar phosphate isomerase/epimerase